MVDRATVEEWIERYEGAWRAPGTDGLGALFSTDARYWVTPMADPQEGLEAIAAMWQDRREGDERGFTMRSSVIAVDEDTAVVRVAVAYVGESPWVDLWVLGFDADGRCRHFEEWPIRVPSG